MSADKETAIKVGQRHGKPLVLVIDTGKMHKAGIPFYQAENGVWLTAHVAPEFIYCLLYTSPSPRDATLSRMPSSA